MGVLRRILPASPLAFAVAALAPAPALAECKIARIVEFPVTMNGRVPMVAGKFGDKEAHFILDSGAFFSTLSRASAAEFGQRVEAAPPYFRVKGIGGDTSAGVVVSKNFALAGVALPGANFVVGGSDTGTAGLIGQNILGLADVEYDLPHGAVRLMRTTGCAKTGLAYWAGDKPFTMVRLDDSAPGPFKPHTIGTVLLNGVRIKAMFDSGANASLLSLAAAKRAGITPESPGVVRAGASRGMGTHQVAAWMAPFDSIDIGGEKINHPKIRIGDIELGNADMLIGADFFLTHRLFVSNANHAVYITYEGGPVFNLSPKGASSADGTPLDLTDKAGEPKTAEDFSRRGAVFASNHRLDEALADFDKAVTLAPSEPRYLFQRASVHVVRREREAALADLDHTLALAPDHAEARLARARMRLARGDTAGAGEDVAAADRALAPSSDQRLLVASLYNDIDQPEAALGNYDLWLKSHSEDSSRPSALNGRCWARGLLNRELDKALSDCNAALHGQPKNPSFLDSRGLVRLRRGETAQALADYDAALAIAPRNAWTLYMRALVAQKTGDTARATADRAAALAINPKVAVRAHRIGLD